MKTTKFRTSRVISGAYLFQLFDDHGECFEDGGGWTGQSDDPLWTVTLRDVDASPTLQTHKIVSVSVKCNK